MKYLHCIICGEFHYTDTKCADEYLVYHEEDSGDEPHVIRAWHHEAAALKYGEHYNTYSDYALMNETIDLKVERNGEVEYYRVGAEPDIYYSSTQFYKS